MAETMGISEIMRIMHGINFSGNLTPKAWYRHLVVEGNGKEGSGKRETKAHLVAITLLSEIVYWYRPKIVRDENTGEISGLARKFRADKLQLSYQDFQDRFTLTRHQVKSGLAYLESKGLITLELRIIPGPNGPLSNVLFIGIDPERIREITHMQVNPNTPRGQLQALPRSTSTPPEVNLNTYTESTSKITTKMTTVEEGAGDDVLISSTAPATFSLSLFNIPEPFKGMSVDDHLYGMVLEWHKKDPGLLHDKLVWAYETCVRQDGESATLALAKACKACATATERAAAAHSAQPGVSQQAITRSSLTSQQKGVISHHDHNESETEAQARRDPGALSHIPEELARAFERTKSGLSTEAV